MLTAREVKAKTARVGVNFWHHGSIGCLLTNHMLVVRDTPQSFSSVNSQCAALITHHPMLSNDLLATLSNRAAPSSCRSNDAPACLPPPLESLILLISESGSTTSPGLETTRRIQGVRLALALLRFGFLLSLVFWTSKVSFFSRIVVWRKEARNHRYNL